MLVAMAGLPGCGKTALARQLAERLAGVILDKDVIRASFEPIREPKLVVNSDLPLEVSVERCLMYLQT